MSQDNFLHSAKELCGVILGTRIREASNNTYAERLRQQLQSHSVKASF